MPWEIGARDELVQAVETGRVRPCRTLDPACGSGSNAVFLAQRGFHVTGVDFAALAIAKARRRAEVAQVSIDFIVDDLTNLRQIADRAQTVKLPSTVRGARSRRKAAVPKSGLSAELLARGR